VNKGRVVLLDIDEEIEVSRTGDDGALYLTLPGSPGVIYCETGAFGENNPVLPGMTLRGVGGGFSGLPGFLRLEGVTEATENDLAESEAVESVAGEP
jgi:hypothetical protein